LIVFIHILALLAIFFDFFSGAISWVLFGTPRSVANSPQRAGGAAKAKAEVVEEGFMVADGSGMRL